MKFTPLVGSTLSFMGLFALAEMSDVQANQRAKAAPSTQSKGEPMQAKRQWTQSIGDWIVKCSQAEAGRKDCVMSQTLASSDLQKPLGVWSIGKDPAGKLTGTVQTPIGVSLQPGLNIAVENKATFNVRYSSCFRYGCFAPFELTTALADQMRNAKRVTVSAQAGRRPINLSFSLRGFGQAYAALLQEIK